MRISCDLHMHSALSPCAMNDMTPNNMVNMALISELTAIAITDHNSCENAAALIEVARRTDTGFVVIPGMEVHTVEDIHVVTLFPDIDAARAMQEYVYAALPDIKATAKQQAKQLVMDADDEVTGNCDKLLNMATSLTLDRVISLSKECGGTAFPAHIDRKSYSILASLGFIPEHLPISCVEVSMYSEPEPYAEKYPQYRVLTDSDSHELGHIGMVFNNLDVMTVSPHGIIKTLDEKPKI